MKATGDLLREKGLVAPLELFIRMELLSPESVEDWRRGRIPYLERAIRCNLSQASRILRILRMHAHDLDLKPAPSVYKRWTRGPRTLLRFSKTGDRAVEDAYARHFLSPGNPDGMVRKRSGQVATFPSSSQEATPEMDRKGRPNSSEPRTATSLALQAGFTVNATSSAAAAQGREGPDRRTEGKVRT